MRIHIFLTVMVMGLVVRAAQVKAEVKTDIRVETNGVVKEFHTTGSEDVNYQSEDGAVKINVNNSTSTSTQNTSGNKTEIENKVKVVTGGEGEDSELNEAEEATSSSEAIEKAEGGIEATEQKTINLIENLVKKWEEWNEAFKDQLRKLFE